tara:strand:- start:87 stop:881 length:795 start_codon:yes stop_codon:yes gene_type:complete
MKGYQFCNNCGKQGHLYHHCKSPITSIGIICYTNTPEGIKYLMICRKDTLGFVDFMRGRYNLNNIDYIKNTIDVMTNDEKHALKTKTFDELWSMLWGSYFGLQYRGEEKSSRDKFTNLKTGIYDNGKLITLNELIDESTTDWKTPEWGFPKGRRNYQEKDLATAYREFNEETGYLEHDIKIINNIIPFEEIFTGSNYKSYKHKYFLAHTDDIKETTISKFHNNEVSALEWKTFQQCVDSIRPYNLEKIKIITQINCILNKYRIY